MLFKDDMRDWAPSDRLVLFLLQIDFLIFRAVFCTLFVVEDGFVVAAVVIDDDAVVVAVVVDDAVVVVLCFCY